MISNGRFAGDRRYGLLVLLIILSCTLFPSGCGNEGQGTFSVEPSESVSVSDTASASLTIRWHDALDAQPATYQRAALDCQASGVSQVVCNVYDTASGNLLASGGPWNCTAGGGRIDNIPVGQDRTFVVLAEDIAGNLIYQGERFNVAISPGQVTEGVVVDAYRFVPSLITPDDGDQVDPNAFSLQWEALNNADEYLVQVAQDNEFNTVVIDTTTPGAIYAPSTLASSTQYFWKIHGVDLYANIGAESETRRFVTSACTYSISSASNTVTAEGGQGSFTVTPSTNDCEWSAVSSHSWVTITSGASGSGSGRVDYTVAANPGPSRTATITVAGNVHTISQTAADCSYSISPTRRTIGGNGGSYNISVSVNIADCEWTASENVSWISLSRTSGTGSGTVQVTVAANTGAARTATITIAGQSHRIDQDPVDCAFTIAPTSQSVSAAGVSYDVSVTATRGDCEWTASENLSWISLSRTSGTGSGTVQVTVAANTGAARTATITVAGNDHTISQTATDCTYRISPTSRSIDAREDEYNVRVRTTPDGCAWTSSENYSWISLLPTSGSGDGTVRVTVSENIGEARSATITIAGQDHTINQDPADCTYSISPTSRLVDADGEAYDVTITATHNGCDWTTSENYNWILLSPTSGSGDGTVTVTVSANYGTARSANITIAGRSHRVDQETEAIDLTPPTVPTGVTITPIDDYISVDWEPSSDEFGVEEYLLNFCMGAGGQCDDYWTTPVSHPTTYLEWESEPDTFYCVRIQACDAAANCSEFSETVCTQTP
jgi:hypothetical protein